MPNVPSDLSLLAFGIPPAREAESAGGMPKVPKGQGLGPLVCSALFLRVARQSQRNCFIQFGYIKIVLLAWLCKDLEMRRG